MKNNKGFTMIELLGAIVILAILMLIAIPTVNSLIQGSKVKYYNTQRKNLETAAKSYLKNHNVIMREVGASTKISMNELVSNKFISVVKDSGKNDCVGKAPADGSQSYTFVYVKRTNNGVKYTAHLWCPKAGNEAIDAPIVENNANINITIDLLKSEQKVRIKLDSTDGKKIKRYSYYIYRSKADYENTLVNKTGDIDATNFTTTYDVSRFVKGLKGDPLYVYVIAVNEDGLTKSGYKKDDFSTAAQVPTCNISVGTPEYKGDNDYLVKWSIKCTSQYGCETDVYRGEEWTTKNDSKNVTVADKVTGASRTCTVSWTLPPPNPPDPNIDCIDDCCDEPPCDGEETVIISPQCPVIVKPSKYSTGWIKGSITVKYRLSRATWRWKPIKYTTSKKVSKKLWSTKDKAKTVRIKFDKTKIGYPKANKRTWGATSKSTTDKTIKFSSTGWNYFAVAVEQSKTKDGKKSNTLCGYKKTIKGASRSTAYGPYRIDNVAPAVSKKSAKAKELKITVKFTVKDKHSGIVGVYVNSKSKCGKNKCTASYIKKHGTSFKNPKSKYNYKKTDKYSAGTHVFWAHAVDKVGNIKNIKIGSAKAKKNPLAGKSGCNWVGTKKRSMGYYCSCGSRHSQGYRRYCIKGGKAKKAGSPRYFCPAWPKYKEFNCDGVHYKRLKGY